MDYDTYDERVDNTRFNRRKKTKTWCRGRVGREHQPEIVIGNYTGKNGCTDTTRFIRWNDGKREVEGAWLCYHKVRCARCKKILQFNPDECPLNFNDIPMYWR